MHETLRYIAVDPAPDNKELHCMIQVLHIDASSQFATFVKRVIEAENEQIDVTTTPPPQKGVADLDVGQQFDCIVSGYKMGGTNGIELLRSLRERGIDTPIILYSWCDGDIEELAFKAGATEYVHKRMGISGGAELADEIIEHSRSTAQR